MAVDPAGTANAASDETGIVVVGISADQVAVRAGRLHRQVQPRQWGSRANAAVEEFSADAIVAEKNYGGDMVRHTLENSGHHPGSSWSTPGGASRSGPSRSWRCTSSKRVVHVGLQGDLVDLENEQTTWVPGEGSSPNRVDALVHGATELVKHSQPALVSNPRDLLKDRRTPLPRHLRVVS